MAVLWTSQNDFHRTLEISPRTRDSHIPTARTSFSFRHKKNKKKRSDHLSKKSGQITCQQQDKQQDKQNSFSYRPLIATFGVTQARSIGVTLQPV